MSEAAGSKPYSEDEAYLYETYVTEDGIEVPPPTKVMGPRRLARYREEVAEYLRAHRRGENPKPVENMGSVVNTGAIDPQVLAVQRRFAALAAQGKIETEANDEEKLHEPAPLTSSLRVLRPDEIAKNRVDATSPSAVDSPLTSSIPVITVVKEEEPEPKMHEYLVRDEPKVDESVVGYASAPAEDEESPEPKDTQEPKDAQKPGASEAAEAQKEDASSNLPTRVSAVNAQGLDLSVLDGSVSGDTVDSVDGDPTVALSPDEVEELLQRMVDRQDPEDSVAMAELAAEESAESKSAPVASVERADSGSQKKDSDKSFAEKVTENQSEHEVLKPAQKTSLAWLWMVLLLALVVVGLIMIFGPK